MFQSELISQSTRLNVSEVIVKAVFRSQLISQSTKLWPPGVGQHAPFRSEGLSLTITVRLRWVLVIRMQFRPGKDSVFWIEASSGEIATANDSLAIKDPAFLPDDWLVNGS